MSKTTLKSPKVVYTPETFRQQLHTLYQGERMALAEGKHFERTAMLLTGAPGSAKTATVKEFANDIDRMIKKANPNAKGCQLITLRLTQCEITDLKGVPVYIERDGQKQCSFASPALFPIKGMPSSADGYDMSIIFFDELQQAIPQMQQLAAAVMDGTIGDQELDESRTFIVACANRVEDSATVFPLPMNLANRFCHGTMEVDPDHWMDWGQKAGINSVILGFLALNTSYLNEPTPPAGTDNTPFATPRTWAKLSQTLNTIEAELGDSWVRHGNESLTRNAILSMVGHSAGTALIATAKNLRESINVTDIEAGNNPPLPEKPDVQFAVVYELIARTNNYLREVNDIPTTEISSIEKAVKNIDPKLVKKIENSILWIDNKVNDSGKKMNKSMAALYRGKNTTDQVKAALQIIGRSNDKVKKSLDLQKDVISQLGR